MGAEGGGAKGSSLDALRQPDHMCGAVQATDTAFSCGFVHAEPVRSLLVRSLEEALELY